ncbi:hypothetical protein [Bacillus sp. UMB0728]|uniref:hypothetical protein n=1 Tax=Bacillus sp. UMB0728 TaxID=2066052 RepID=UPI000C78E725|nr:hypothetical protein [Bacillus sp. UMB0728]PLR73682.1 hypothetical protein CYJ37_09155 [Bacillus sp. UMB0728]
MNNRVQKLIAGMLVLLMAFSLIPKNTLGASNLNAYMTDAKNKATVLKWAISIEGSGDGKTRPWKQYNDAKDANAKALAMINSSKPANAALLETTLKNESEVHIKRAMHYIDAITAGEKITEKKIQLSALIKTNKVNDELEAAYHSLSAEIRKQGVLLDRVYGQSTRDLIRNNYKNSAETVRNSIKNAITVKMELDEMEAALAAGDRASALEYFNDVKLLLPSVKPDAHRENLKLRFNELGKKYSLGDTDVPEKVELSVQDIKKALTAEARKHGIPPEVLKAIAITENQDFRQFNDDGSPFVSLDGGIGIMQVTLGEGDSEYNLQRLQYDTLYNIEKGTEILLSKWDYGGSRTPIINGNEKDILENWYFAILAYNGLSFTNDPARAAGQTYQEKVFENMGRYGQVYPSLIPEAQLSITYPNGLMDFKGKMLYQTVSKTKSTELYKAGDVVTLSTGGYLRQQPSTDGKDDPLPAGTKVIILDGTFEDIKNNLNLFAWYKVQIQGTNKVGYIASFNLK